MNAPILCPACQSDLAYFDGTLHVCPECAHEWDPSRAPADAAAPVEHGLIVVDAHGTRLSDGDTVVVIKDLKVRGASGALKVGTRVRGIRLVEGDHNIDCRIDGFGAMQLKSEFVRKA
jgi:protein PhnA